MLMLASLAAGHIDPYAQMSACVTGGPGVRARLSCLCFELEEQAAKSSRSILGLVV